MKRTSASNDMEKIKQERQRVEHEQMQAQVRVENGGHR